ncbi:hypothetical protein [Rhizobium sp. WW_1]|nr:hypothetical protein [Rhizobium sp. WW_1]
MSVLRPNCPVQKKGKRLMQKVIDLFVGQRAVFGHGPEVADG